jgi:hypothetical protein
MCSALETMLAALHHGHPATITVRSVQTQGLSARLLLCFMPPFTPGDRRSVTQPDLFIVVTKSGHATAPARQRVSPEWARTQLKLSRHMAALVAALLDDLAQAQQRLRDVLEERAPDDSAAR